MSEKICPVGFNFVTNRYSNAGIVPKPQHRPTVVLDSAIYDYGDVFEQKYFEPKVLYSWEENGRVKGLFEGKNSENFVSLTKTTGGGLIEKVKKGASALFAVHASDGRLTDLVEVTKNKTTFIDIAGKVSEATGAAAKEKLVNVLRGIVII